MRFSNLHTHTTYSDGKGTVRENIESAIRKNMLSIGFSDHSFTACDTSYCMKEEAYAAYCAEVRALAAEYRDRIPVYLGMEKDYYSEIDRGSFDYVIASVHYIVKNGVCYPIDHSRRQQEECIADAFGGSVLDMAKCYYEMVAEHAATAKPDIIGHFDVLNKFSIMPEQDERYMHIAEEALREAFRHCKRFEINTGAIARGWRTEPYPAPHLMRLLKELGAEIVINSDSHHPDNLDHSFEKAVKLLRTAGFDRFTVLGKNGFEAVALTE